MAVVKILLCFMSTQGALLQYEPDLGPIPILPLMYWERSISSIVFGKLDKITEWVWVQMGI